MTSFKSVCLRTALSGAVLALSAGTATAQSDDFPPFPEPAIGPFPDTRNMKLLGQLTPSEIGAVTPRAGVLLNDIEGWTSPKGEEYALVGTGDGMSIVRITDPRNPVFIGIVPTTKPDDFANLWGDVGIFNVRRSRHDDDKDKDLDVVDFRDGGDKGKDFVGYAYYTTEAVDVGIHILELNQLDDMGPAPGPSFQIAPTAVFNGGGYSHAHNIYVNQSTGFAYVAGVHLVADGETACDDEPFHPSRFNTLILDLKPDPLDPVVVACRADAGEHDFYVVKYRGPDRDYVGREIAFVFDGRDKDALGREGLRMDDTPGVPVGGATEIWDVTHKDDIRVISSFVPKGLCFSHQGWTSSNRHEFLLINDELDELRDAEEPGGEIRTSFCQSDADPVIPNPSLYVVNIRDLDNPFLQERFFIDSPGDNDHNFIREGDKLYWAVYNAGTRVLKLRHRTGMLQLEEIARLDSEPRMPPVFNGQWGIFPLGSSRTIVASDIVNGLMVMRLHRDRDRHWDHDDGPRIASTTMIRPTSAEILARIR